jgi:DNA polymerase-1
MCDKTVVIVDADSLVYQACTSALKQIEWSPGYWTQQCDMADAKTRFVNEVEMIEEKLNACKIVMALGDYDNPNWRLDVMESYKANRVATVKPLCFWPMREWIADRWETFIRPTLEGDDVCGILLTSPFARGSEKILVSLDKDMMTLPGKHVNYLKAFRDDDWTVTEISTQEADYNHLMQTLTGDRTDGYPGCPGVGPVNARKILDVPVKDQWAAIVAAYEKKGLSEQDALDNARVARIIRHRDFDYKAKTVKIWNP